LSDDQSPVDDLFGDEGLRIEDGSDERRLPRKTIPLKGWMVGTTLLVVALVWWWSSIRHNQFYLVVEDRSVSVKRGYFFPFGEGDWAPNRAYESFQLPPDIKPVKDGKMSAKELDKTLKKLFMDVAQRELNDLKQGRIDVAEDMLLRGQKLRSTSVSDDRVLLRLLGDVAFRRGLTEVRGLQARFDEALAQFRLAHRRGGNVFNGAQKWVKAISKLRLEFKRLSLESGIDPDLLLNSAQLDPQKPVKNTPLPVPNQSKKSESTPNPKAIKKAEPGEKQ